MSGQCVWSTGVCCFCNHGVVALSNNKCSDDKCSNVWSTGVCWFCPIMVSFCCQISNAQMPNAQMPNAQMLPCSNANCSHAKYRMPNAKLHTLISKLKFPHCRSPKSTFTLVCRHKQNQKPTPHTTHHTHTVNQEMAQARVSTLDWNHKIQQQNTNTNTNTQHQHHTQHPNPNRSLTITAAKC